MAIPKSNNTVQIPVDMVQMDLYICTKLTMNAPPGCPVEYLGLRLYGPEQVLPWEANRAAEQNCLETNAVNKCFVLFKVCLYLQFITSSTSYKEKKIEYLIRNSYLRPD